ncbi:ankyrin repeat domain-containing protein 27-like [Anneissia japonica]|uniref:ankyrin repeat domain-containing protein 27-like n=1 Tax=Anneissia japonica TaxID=1529436 RepID=UPI001425A156|nr:ankyrin repeat domain-containing protein 27-like [Anneissia japonica]
MSAENGNSDICRLLIQSGANKDIQTKYGWTSVMTAAHFNKYDIVKLLVRDGANSDVQNLNGDTALHVAAYWGYSSVVKLLLDTGASILLSKKGNTPLHACFLNQNLSYDHHRNVTVAFMMTHSNIVSIKNSDGKTVIDLHEESECRRYETEHRCLQKEELLLILKGGQFPVINFTPSGSTVPSIIQTHGPSSVKTYTEALEDGIVEVNLGTIKVIGQERAGKTCLINSCLGKKFNQDEEITDGIATTKIITRTTNKTDVWSENLTNVGKKTNHNK